MGKNGGDMKFWQMVTWAETEHYCDIARCAEELGFHGIMNADHAFFPQQVNSPYPYSTDGKPPMATDSEYPDAWVSLAQMAAVTSRLMFSTSVYVLPLRNPIEVAKATGSLALMSNNRFILGAGVGWMKEEFDAYGVDFRSRGKRYDECLDAIQQLWTGEWTQYHGEHVRFDALRILPAPTQKVPVYLGGSSEIALRRIARRADGYIGNGNTVEEVPPLLAHLQALREQAGRAQEPFETVLGLSGSPDVDTYRRLQDYGMTSGVSPPFAFTLGWQSSMAQKREQMERFAEAFVRPLADD
jgi:probable F420-dependent oxidoreductase